MAQLISVGGAPVAVATHGRARPFYGFVEDWSLDGEGVRLWPIPAAFASAASRAAFESYRDFQSRSHLPKDAQRIALLHFGNRPLPGESIGLESAGTITHGPKHLLREGAWRVGACLFLVCGETKRLLTSVNVTRTGECIVSKATLGGWSLVIAYRKDD